MSAGSGFNSQSEFTRSDLSELGANDSSFDPSYTALQMAHDRNTTKRQKRSAGNFNCDNCHENELEGMRELENDLREATFD